MNDFPSILQSAEDERRAYRQRYELKPLRDKPATDFLDLHNRLLLALLPTRGDSGEIPKLMKDQVTQLLDQVVAILERDGKTIVDLAKEIECNYYQVYDWVKRRKFNPQAEGILRLQAWRDKHISPCAAKRRPRRSLIGAQRS